MGGTGQARLRAARVLVVGAGGLGCPAALYLAAAGVGTIGIADHDHVDVTNLQRQIAHTTARVGERKTRSLAAAVEALNPLVRVEQHDVAVDADGAGDLVAPYDLVCDMTDNIDARYALNDACLKAGRTLISAAALRFDGQIMTVKRGSACYRCLHPVPPERERSCGEAGVLGAVTGVIGSLAATEAIKEILGIGEGLAGRLLLWDALGARFQTIRVPSDPACPNHALHG